MENPVDIIAKALVAAQKSMSSAVKDSVNPFFGKAYADLNSVREACMPALNENGIAVLQPTVTIDGVDYVQTTLLHESGQMFISMTKIVVSKPNDAQAQGSGISYARRYGLQSLMNVGSEDDDGNAASDAGKKEAPKEQKAAPITGEKTKLQPKKMETNKNFDQEKTEEAPKEEKTEAAAVVDTPKKEEPKAESPKVEEPPKEKKKLTPKNQKTEAAATSEKPVAQEPVKQEPVKTEKNPPGDFLFDKLDKLKTEVIEKINSFTTPQDLMDAAPDLIGNYRAENPSETDFEIVRKAANDKYDALLEAEKESKKQRF